MTFRGKVLLVVIGALAIAGLLHLLNAPGNAQLVINASNNVVINIGVDRSTNWR